jgi:hypothetical protein
MSRISRYQESMLRFVKTKSSFCDIIKLSIDVDNINACNTLQQTYKNNDNDNEKDSDLGKFIHIGDHEASITLLTILNGQNKKMNMKLHHGYYMASGIDLLMLHNEICDNPNYYTNTYGDECISNILAQMPIHINECLHQNIETLENFLEKEKIIKLHRKISSYLRQKLIDITKYENITGNSHVHKTDIIKFKFDDKSLITNKYKKMKLIDKDILINHVNKTYGLTCQCAFVLGWLLGLGDYKMINNLERLGTHLGLLIKLSKDFANLERDIKYSDKTSFNMLVNYGIHESFDLFTESKVKLIEGCLTLGIYNTTIKEVIDFIEKKFDTCLNNTDLELESRYSSFSNMS